MTPERGIDPGFAERGSGIGYGRSDMIAFAAGGLMIAGGLLTFLYYEGDQLGRHAPTRTEKALRFESPAQPVPNIVTAPAAERTQLARSAAR